MNKLLQRRWLVAGSLAALACAALPLAVTHAAPLARVDVYDRTDGTALTVYRHRGRGYVAGEPGNEYAIRVRNCSGRRLLAVVSVDGVNVVTGETATPDQSGYVIEPGDYVNIQGWRKDLDRTAAFYFTDPGDSYASRTGRPLDLGVIGVALFVEAQPDPVALREDQVARGEPPLPAPPAAERSAPQKSAGRADTAAAPVAADTSGSLGTGHGRRESSPVNWVAFERASDRPDQVVALRYETRATLAAMGVLPKARLLARRDPQPFPGSNGFVPDP